MTESRLQPNLLHKQIFLLLSFSFSRSWFLLRFAEQELFSYFHFTTISFFAELDRRWAPEHSLILLLFLWMLRTVHTVRPEWRTASLARNHTLFTGLLGEGCSVSAWGIFFSFFFHTRSTRHSSRAEHNRGGISPRTAELRQWAAVLKQQTLEEESVYRAAAPLRSAVRADAHWRIRKLQEQWDAEQKPTRVKR